MLCSSKSTVHRQPMGTMVWGSVWPMLRPKTTPSSGGELVHGPHHRALLFAGVVVRGALAEKGCLGDAHDEATDFLQVASDAHGLEQPVDGMLRGHLLGGLKEEDLVLQVGQVRAACHQSQHGLDTAAHQRAAPPPTTPTPAPTGAVNVLCCLDQVVALTPVEVIHHDIRRRLHLHHACAVEDVAERGERVLVHAPRQCPLAHDRAAVVRRTAPPRRDGGRSGALSCR
mmetsp:Transcript_7328/g.19691  ORF Transcript_7328/g.19691 Transcript_7328/m.19691 type:complete len:228 (-) Transcript_7328:436-1119(-)